MINQCEGSMGIIKSDTIKDTVKISAFTGFEFIVENYQRGYKWTIQQVLDLLEDINGFESEKGGFYCLQPLALIDRSIDRNINVYEVIDGQQRLTTIYILLSLIEKPHYIMRYRTRDKSEEFLEKIIDEFKGTELISYDLIKKDIFGAERRMIELWKKYAQSKPEYDNTDIFHFFLAYKTIESWKKNNYKNEFIDKLKEQTRFIWYIEERESDAKKVFRDLNSGKIALTNAELIKAHFINNLKDSNFEIQNLKQNELATEWDFIEKELHDEGFWYFINNDTNPQSYETRIDFLFEMLAGTPNRNDKYYSYRKFTQEDDSILN